MDAATLAPNCEEEIVALHRFFTDWFRGTLPDTDAVWARVEGVLAPGFTLISPEGRTFRREDLLEAVRGQHASRPPPEMFEIHVQGIESRCVGEQIVIATYEEWQRTSEGEIGRRSTAVFDRRDTAPHGVRWLHVHETWLSTER